MEIKSLIIKTIVLLCLTNSFVVSADEQLYLVKDNNSGLYETFASFDSAEDYYEKNIDEYDNLLLYDEEKLIKMEYGVVKFNDYTNYYSCIKNYEDILCTKYGIDGAYLYSEDDDVYFKVAGDLGYTNKENVTLIPFEELKVNTSLYHCDDDYLYHYIKTQLDYEYFSSALKIDFIPEFLEKNKDYYSYDTHFFYDDFYTMIDDYRSGINTNAINETAYYNYYQYLPYRSTTNIDYSKLEDYFYNTLKIDGRLVRYNDLNMDSAADEINRSQLYGIIDDFYTYQNVYGTNALLLLTSAVNDSSYGKSFASFYNNNLFTIAAYENATEANNDRYDSISSSINSYAKYLVSNRFSNYNRDDYCGSFLGDKSSGITSTYSLDHYYGERVASKYFDIDNKFGLLDYNNYSIGIISNGAPIYCDRELNDYLYSIDKSNDLSFILLDEFEDAYLIQLEDSNNDEYLYDYEECVGYISKDSVSSIINPGKYNDNDFVSITYDFNGGSFLGQNSMSIKTKVGDLPTQVKPTLNGYEFIGYDKQLINAYNEVAYTALYSQIDSISIGYLFNKQEELYPTIDLSKAYISVKYTDGTSKKVAITTDMLSFVDTTNNDKQTITISYCGLSLEKTIQIDEAITKRYKNVTDGINNGDYKLVKDNLVSITYPFMMPTIREIDDVIRLDNKRNYVIKDNTNKYELSISGLDLSLDDKSSLSFFKDTYYVEVNEILPMSRDKILSLAMGYGFVEECGINISFKFNFQNIQLKGPAIVQLDVADKKNDCIYSVYHIDDNGDIIKCRTTHSNNYVQFIINEEGDYLLLSKPSANKYDIIDGVENLSYENMGFDNHKFNLNVLFITLLDLVCITGIIIYYIISNKKEAQWRDYRKSLLKADIVQEEKLKN